MTKMHDLNPSQEGLFADDPAAARAVLASGRTMARADAATSQSSAAQLAFARAFCHRLVTAYWARLDTDSHLRSLFGGAPLARLPEPAATLADRLGAAAALLPPEHAFYEIGLSYNVTLPNAWRAAYGVYYTPPALAERLLDQAAQAGVDWATCRALDPACGGGAFLAPIARRMAAAIGTCSPAVLLQNLATRLHGYEIDPFSAWLSQVALDAVLLPVTHKAKRAAPLLVSVCDALERIPPQDGFDLVVGNPPYGRVKLADAQRVRYRRSLYGHANLYGLFTDLALHHTRCGGVIAYVTPTSFLAGGYYKNLRALLASESAPVSLDFIDQRKGVFEDVLQETLLACYRKDGQRRTAAAHTLMTERADRLRVEHVGDFQLPVDGAAPWLVPRNRGQGKLIERLSAMIHRLSDWGYGVSTGPLVWNRHKGQLRKSRGKNRFPLIWAEAVTSDGQFLFRADKRNHLPYFETKSGDDWLVITASCVLLQRTTAKEQKRRLIAAELPEEFLDTHGGAVVENHLNMIRPIATKTRITPTALTALLNSAAMDHVFRCLSGSVAVSAYELEALPLPKPAQLSRLETLVRNGTARELIENECMRLYGLEHE